MRARPFFFVGPANRRYSRGEDGGLKRDVNDCRLARMLGRTSPLTRHQLIYFHPRYLSRLNLLFHLQVVDDEDLTLRRVLAHVVP